MYSTVNNNEKNKYVKDRILIFVSILIIKMLFSLFLYSLTYYKGTDEFGTIAGASILAGLDWKEAISGCSYYGFGYSILMTPVLFLFSNPYIVFHLLYGYNAVCLAFSAIICHYFLDNVFKIDGRILKIVISLAATTFIGNWTASNSIINDTPLILCLWLTVCFLVKCVNKTESNHPIKLISFLFSLFLAYGITIHTRMIYFWGGVFVFIFIYWLLRKKCIVNIPIFIITFIGCYILFNSLIKVVQHNYWLPLDGQILTNSVESLGNSFQNFSKVFTIYGFGAAVSTIIGQLFGMMSLSGGIFIFFPIWCISIISDILLTLFKKEKNDMEKVLYLSLSIMVIAIVFVIIFTTSLGALGSTSELFYQNSGSKWYLYERYWGICAGLMTMLMAVRAIKYIEKISWLKIGGAGLGLYSWISVVFLAFIAPKFEGIINKDSYVYYLYSPFCFRKYTDIIMPFDFVYLFAFILVLFLIILVLLFKKKFFGVFCILLVFNIYSYSYVTINLHNPMSKELYEEYEDITNVIYSDLLLTPETAEIYCDGNAWFNNGLQFTLSRFSVKVINENNYSKTTSDTARDKLVIAVSDTTQMYYMEQGYQTVYIKSDSMYYDNIHLLYLEGDN